MGIPAEAFVFFLGGHDLEMVTIRALIEAFAPGRCHDLGLSWGAKASAYRDAIAEARSSGQVPVLVELEDDLGLSTEAGPSSIVVVDHHGPRAGKDQPTSLHQVFDLLEIDPSRWTRWHDLVAANDRGHIAAMRELGATQDEIVRVRAADRSAQGITPEQDAQGEQAVATVQRLANGRLSLVSLPHTRTAALADRLASELGGPGYENLLILCPCQLHFYGQGPLVVALNDAFPGGWYGGALPDRGFWGHPIPVPDALAFLLDRLAVDVPLR